MKEKNKNYKCYSKVTPIVFRDHCYGFEVKVTEVNSVWSQDGRSVISGRGAARGGPQGMRRARHEDAVRRGGGGGPASRPARELAARGGRRPCPTEAG